jgi:threonylcarbamoyladenosine tRNA methylthiotransferase MtaB
MDAIADEPRLMPHVHLSMQAGDDMILKRMKRRHLRADAIHFCEAARKLRPDITFGADLIAGFPTETEEMFANSLRLVDECALIYLHVFPYSRRPGTPAARMPQVDGAVVKARAARLRAKGQLALASHLDRQVGRDAEILLEQDNLGRTPDFAQVLVECDDVQSPVRGDIVAARVTRSDGARLYASLSATTSAR